MAVTWWGWALTLGLIAALLSADLLSQRLGPLKGTRGSLLLSIGWISSAALFGLGLGLWGGWGVAAQYYSGYLLEKALSVDNLFVFAVIFSSLGVPRAQQHRVLYYGVVGALVLRAIFIAAGGAFFEHVTFAPYVFGGFLLLSGARLFGGVRIRLESNRMLQLLERRFRLNSRYSGAKFFVRVDGHVAGTGLLLALIAIEATDVLFATDSIPAIFGITRDLFIVFVSNAFAVLGLRSLYFLLAEAIDRFVYLGKGLSVLLVLIGLKMLLSEVVLLPPWSSLVAIVVVLGVSVALSISRAPNARGVRPSSNGSPS